ncbi:hypothetical protein [Endozoicomonas sp. ONNA1]|uniref:hypothetical protein n=1 Tax=Endozoicomonas sp. ONNA1 TaxID=2828740 RepID=UPI002147362A|nr:hypothetical protein [Endozoicomonas sp. ONNA1]
MKSKYKNDNELKEQYQDLDIVSLKKVLSKMENDMLKLNEKLLNVFSSIGQLQGEIRWIKHLIENRESIPALLSKIQLVSKDKSLDDVSTLVKKTSAMYGRVKEIAIKLTEQELVESYKITDEDLKPNFFSSINESCQNLLLANLEEKEKNFLLSQVKQQEEEAKKILGSYKSTPLP